MQAFSRTNGALERLAAPVAVNRRPRRTRLPVATCQLFPAYYPLTGHELEQDLAAHQIQRDALRKRSNRSGGSRNARRESETTEPNPAEAEYGAPADSEAFKETPETDKLAQTNTGQATGRTKRKRRSKTAVSEEELQILERKARSLSGETSTAEASEPFVATELIFKLERLGEGWGEELLPRITIEKRPLSSIQQPPRRNRGRRKIDPWEEGSPEVFLRDHCRVPEDKVDAVMTTATAWRVTAGGRPLIDRRRRSRVSRNVREVAAHLQKMGVPPGRTGIGKVFMKAPQVMLCKPSSADRWGRRAVELAAYAHKFGDCNVSEEDRGVRDLAMWVKRQRVLWQQGDLVHDRMAILAALGFEVGAEAQITEEWEYCFDQLVEWLLLAKIGKAEDGAGRDWFGLDWGERGGMRARECCIWVQFQRELRRRNLLPAGAIRRLDSLGIPWTVEGGTPEETRWMRHFGRLIFTVEREKKLSGIASSPVEDAAFPSENRIPDMDGRLLPETGDPQALLGHREDLSVTEFAWLQQVVAARRDALAAASLEPRLSYWLAAQRRAWRRGILPREQTLMLRLLGFEFDLYPGIDAWRAEAHAAAAFLMGSQLRQDLQHVDQDQIGGLECSRGHRLRISRWVMTQQALYAERRLSLAQIRYLALLELSWLLDRGSLPTGGTHLEQQTPEMHDIQILHSRVKQKQLRALHAMGWLQEEQVQRISLLGVVLEVERSREDLEWDHRLTELLAYRREHGDCRVPASGWRRAPELGPWLQVQLALWRQDTLPPLRVAQLSALGVEQPQPAMQAALARN